MLSTLEHEEETKIIEIHPPVGGSPTHRKAEVLNFASLHWDTIEQVKESWRIIIQAYGSGSISEGQAKTLGYLVGKLLDIAEFERDSETVAKKLQSIQSLLEKRGLI